MDEKIRSGISRFTPFPHDVIQSEIELVVREHLQTRKLSVFLTCEARTERGSREERKNTHLFRRIESSSSRILIRFRIVYFESCEERVLESDVYSDDRVNDCSRFVGFEG